MQHMDTITETPEVRPHWRDVLREQGRSMTWLARQTGKAHATVQSYAYRPDKVNVPQEWLDKVSELLGVPVS